MRALKAQATKALGAAVAASCAPLLDPAMALQRSADAAAAVVQSPGAAAATGAAQAASADGAASDDQAGEKGQCSFCYDDELHPLLLCGGGRCSFAGCCAACFLTWQVALPAGRHPLSCSGEVVGGGGGGGPRTPCPQTFTLQQLLAAALPRSTADALVESSRLAGALAADGRFRQRTVLHVLPLAHRLEDMVRQAIALSADRDALAAPPPAGEAAADPAADRKRRAAAAERKLRLLLEQHGVLSAEVLGKFPLGWLEQKRCERAIKVCLTRSKEEVADELGPLDEYFGGRHAAQQLAPAAPRQELRRLFRCSGGDGGCSGGFSLPVGVCALCRRATCVECFELLPSEAVQQPPPAGVGGCQLAAASAAAAAASAAQPHRCSAAAASVRDIKASTQSCPKCYRSINRISGCDQARPAACELPRCGGLFGAGMMTWAAARRCRRCSARCATPPSATARARRRALLWSKSPQFDDPPPVPERSPRAGLQTEPRRWLLTSPLPCGFSGSWRYSQPSLLPARPRGASS